MITDMNARVAMAQKLSIPQLQQAIKNGTVPAYVGVPLLQDKMRQQQQMAMAQQGQQGQQQRPLAEEVMEQAGAMGGVDRLPSNLPIQNEEDEENYAGGGIIAFSGDRTSDVRDPDRRSPTDRGLDELIARINSSANNNIVIPPAANTGTAVAAPETFPIDGISPEFGGSSITPEQDAERVAKIKEGLGYDPSTVYDFLRPPPKTATTKPEVLGSEFGKQGTIANRNAPAANPPGAGTPAGGASRVANIPLTTDEIRSEAAAGKGSVLDQYAAMLMDERKGVAKDRQAAKAMAIFQAGLGIAGGTSPNPFANIAQGALPATQAYQQEMRGIRKEDADRLKQLMSLGIGKEKLELEAKKLGITEKRFNQMYDLETAKLGVMGGQRADARAQAEELRRLTVAKGLFETLRKDQMMTGASDEDLWARAQRMAGQAGAAPVSSGSSVMGTYVPGKGYIPK